MFGIKYLCDRFVVNFTDGKVMPDITMATDGLNRARAYKYTSNPNTSTSEVYPQEVGWKQIKDHYSLK